MSVAWTKDQEKVIDLRNRNILVSAAAGSGKTAVLVERIVGRILEKKQPLDIDEILVVTFTEAAASEMRERILKKLQELAKEQPKNRHLHKQTSLIYHSNISTIHGFCGKVIKENVHLLAIDADYRVGEEGEMELMKNEAISNVMELYYGSQRKEFMTLLEWLSPNKDDNQLVKQILKLHGYARSYPLPKEWFRHALSLYETATKEELLDSRLVSYMESMIQKRVKDALENLHIAKKVCDEPDGPYPYAAAIVEDIVLFKKMQGVGYYEIENLILSHTWKAIGRISKKDEDINFDKKDFVAALRNNVKAMYGDIVKSFFFLPVKQMAQNLQKCLPVASVLVELTEAFSEEFQRIKRRNHVIDFSDMEHFALDILTEEREGVLVPSKVARHYQEAFEEVMVDEYQDSNLLQEVILDSVSRNSRGERNRFMVGDVKQSIYRFRLARPDIFMEKYKDYQVGDDKKQRVDLLKNFRSREEIVATVNFLFSQLMAEDMGGVQYDELARLNVGSTYPMGAGHETELLIGEKIWVNENGEEEKISGAIQELEFEALGIAKRIHRLLEEEIVTDRATGQLRKAQYGDIVILMRSGKNAFGAYKKVFREEEIPVQINEKTGYYETKEITLLLNYLQILDNPNQDIPLAAVLVSYLGGFKEAELARIRSLDMRLTFYEVVEAYSKLEENNDLKERLISFLERMEKYREIATYLPLHELIWRILHDSCFMSYCGALPGGEQRVANIEMLLVKARDFESSSYTGLHNFVEFMRKLADNQSSEGEADISGAQVNQVRIMTIHKSKGLEFPIVFLANTGKMLGGRKEDGIPKHPTMGFGLDVIDPDKRTKSTSLVKEIMKQDLRAENQGEELRVLYVALTRAKEKLIISGLADSYESLLARHAKVLFYTEDILPFSLRVDATTYLDLIMPALMRQEEGEKVCTPILYNQGSLLADTREKVIERIYSSHRTWEELISIDNEAVFEPDIHKQLEEQFDYTYPHLAEPGRKMKYTVSELKKLGGLTLEEAGDLLMEEEEVVPLLPKFMQGETTILEGASRGSAYHAFLELIDSRKTYDMEMLKEELNCIKETNKMSKEMINAIELPDIMEFLQSSVGRRMSLAAQRGKLYKEQPFLIEEEEGILIQGIIDVYFEEEDSIIVMDYKTDRVKSAKELRDRYQIQLAYYAKALEQLTRKKVTEKIIYSFTLREEVEV